MSHGSLTVSSLAPCPVQHPLYTVTYLLFICHRGWWSGVSVGRVIHTYTPSPQLRSSPDTRSLGIPTAANVLSTDLSSVKNHHYEVNVPRISAILPPPTLSNPLRKLTVLK
eukprot:TRINITY_DN71855_c0_g1_i6.p1 TRINITY_DN71855_c0_g1~~TRINITY_DN71855_c0_g1_i6.p1  ORF type:complete len:111 (+),score=11.62 TRINITY_DN71855_c0_g1_i6:282-614(+)